MDINSYFCGIKEILNKYHRMTIMKTIKICRLLYSQNIRGCGEDEKIRSRDVALYLEHFWMQRCIMSGAWTGPC